VATLAELLRALEAEEVPICVGFLSGVPRQGRVGIGYAAIRGLERTPAEEPSLTVADDDQAISDNEAETGSGSAGRRRELLERLMTRATEPESAFLVGLLTGGLRQGALAGLMADAVAKAAGVRGEIARRALMLSGDLTEMARIAIADGEAGLRAVGFELFRPILPMLASTGANVGEALAGFARASVEYKLDGIRIQIHRRGDEVRIYTRNLNEITETLPGIVDAVRRLPVAQAVLDGEAIWMDAGGPAPFQYTVSQIDSGAPPEGIVTFLFDVLHVDGEDLLDIPLHARIARLEEIASGHRIPGVFTSDPAEAQRVLDEAIAAGHEGVVVKDAESLYAAGRRGKAWRKVKPVRTYDLVVLGAEWGHGRRQGWLSNLHLGARDPGSGGFVMVGKTFKGLTDELLRWQTDALLSREVERRGIAVMVRPELVVEIALDGVQSSTRYPGGIALRFARVKRYRADKDALQADVIGDLQALLPGRG
jgi:DNA ligase-1